MARRRRNRSSRRRRSAKGDRLLSYLGGALLVVGAFVAIGKVLASLTPGARAVLIVLTIMAVVFVFAYVLRRKYLKLRAKDRYYAAKDSRKLYVHMNPQEFEQHVAWVFTKAGYEVDVTPYQKDHGIDIVMRKTGKRYAVQVKKYGMHNPVSEQNVRDFYGSIANLGYERGFLVTSGRFTAEAQAWSRPRALTLMNGAELMERVENAELYTPSELWGRVFGKR